MLPVKQFVIFKCAYMAYEGGPSVGSLINCPAALIIE